MHIFAKEMISCLEIESSLCPSDSMVNLKFTVELDVKMQRGQKMDAGNQLQQNSAGWKNKQGLVRVERNLNLRRKIVVQKKPELW